MDTAGNNTIYGQNGNDKIIENSDSFDTLEFYYDINPDDIKSISIVNDDLILTINGNSEFDENTITVEKWNIDDSHKLEEIIFADGTAWDSNKLESEINDPNAIIIAGNRNDFIVDVDSKRNQYVIKEISTGLVNYYSTDIKTFKFSDKTVKATDTDFANDVIVAGAGRKTIYAGTGDDRVILTETDKDYEIVHGGDGTDTVVFSGNRSDYTIGHEDRYGRYNVRESSTGKVNYVYDDVESYEFTDKTVKATDTDFANDVIVAGAGRKTIYAGTGDDRVILTETDKDYEIVHGGDGTDTVVFGGIRSDYIIGHEDRYGRYNIRESSTGKVNYVYDDVESYEFSDKTVKTSDTNFAGDIITTEIFKSNVNAGSGSDTLKSVEGKDIIIDTSLTPANSIENIVGEGGENTILRGDAGNNTIDLTDIVLSDISAIDGGSGHDKITGSAGNDVIIGGNGNDDLKGGAGDDTYIIGREDGIDTITESGGEDVLKMDVKAEDAAFIQSGNDLRIMFDNANMVDVKGWFEGEEKQIEKIETNDNMVLYHNQVAQLVQAMAGFEDEKGTPWLSEIHKENQEAKDIVANHWTYEKVENE